MGKKFCFKSKKKNRINFIEQADFDNSFEYVRSYRVEILSNNEMLIEGCEKILDYNSDYIKLKLAKIALIVFGKDFKVLSFEENQIKISGSILSLEFCD